MKFNGPKVKLSRSLGIPLTTKAQKYLEKRAYPPGQHGQRKRRKLSNYGKQLLEKQRLRFQYNVSERHLRKLFASAARGTGRTGEALVQMLECRLDAFVLRAGLARTIYQSRQLVGHGHVLVNGRKVDIASARLKPGDLVAVKEASRTLRVFNDRLSSSVPTYIDVRENGYEATLQRVPDRHEIPILCEEQLVVEFYSR